MMKFRVAIRTETKEEVRAASALLGIFTNGQCTDGVRATWRSAPWVRVDGWHCAYSNLVHYGDTTVPPKALFTLDEFQSVFVC